MLLVFKMNSHSHAAALRYQGNHYCVLVHWQQKHKCMLMTTGVPCSALTGQMSDNRLRQQQVGFFTFTMLNRVWASSFWTCFLFHAHNMRRAFSGFTKLRFGFWLCVDVRGKKRGADLMSILVSWTFASDSLRMCYFRRAFVLKKLQS